MSDSDMMSNEDGDAVDYTGLVVKDMYEILTTQRNPWPGQYTKLKKLEFLDKMLVYLRDKQMYEMCDGIHKMKEEIKNERIIKGDNT
jgi:hypothetical protein